MEGGAWKGSCSRALAVGLEFPLSSPIVLSLQHFPKLVNLSRPSGTFCLVQVSHSLFPCSVAPGQRLPEGDLGLVHWWHCSNFLSRLWPTGGAWGSGGAEMKWHERDASLLIWPAVGWGGVLWFHCWAG
jgi:hypothetical protein